MKSTFNIAVVENDKIQSDFLINCIRKSAENLNISVKIKSYEDGLDIVEDMRILFDIIYFDIEMKFLDGITSAKRIRERDGDVLIVFVTNHIQYAIEGYEVNASDFLLKPVKYLSFLEHFKKTIKKVSSDDEPKLVIKSSNVLRSIKYADIYFLESEGHYIHIHTVNETIVVKETMKNMETKLILENQKNDFSRSNNCYIVNLAHVMSVNKDTLTIGSHELKISRPRRKQFMEALVNYMGEI